MAHRPVVGFRGVLPHHRECFERVRPGFAAHGFDLRWNATAADFFACWGATAAKGVPGDVLIFECGYLGDRLKNWSVAWNGLNNRGHAPACIPNRADWSAQMSPWRSQDGYALILGQVRGDRSLDECPDYEGFLASSGVALADAGYVVRFRAHPKDGSLRVKGVPSIATDTLSDALDRARVCLTWNSNSAVDAIMAGIPVIVWDKGSMALQVAAYRDIAERRPWRNDWLRFVEARQWSLPELERGDFLPWLLQSR